MPSRPRSLLLCYYFDPTSRLTRVILKVRFALILEDLVDYIYSTDIAREALYNSLQGNFSVKPLEFPLWNLVPNEKKKKKKGNTRVVIEIIIIIIIIIMR